jgi:hypothetical protein
LGLTVAKVEGENVCGTLRITGPLNYHNRDLEFRATASGTKLSVAVLGAPVTLALGVVKNGRMEGTLHGMRVASVWLEKANKK